MHNQFHIRKGKNVMFTINKQEYEEIVSMISGYCCPCTGRDEHCAETECDVQMICEILWDHVDRNDIKSDEGKSIVEEYGEEFDIDWNDELPFRK